LVLSVRFQALTISKAPEYLQEGGPKGGTSFEFRVPSFEFSTPKSAVRTPHSSIAPIAVVLIEFTVEGFAANAECARGVSLVAVGVIERRFDRLTLNFVH